MLETIGDALIGGPKETPPGIWNDRKICEWAEKGGVTPFISENINPASLDLTLGNTYRKPVPADGSAYDDISFYNEDYAFVWSDPIDIADGLTLRKGDFILCHSAETVNIPVNAASCLFLKSTPGRQGLNHSHSGWGDPGFSGQWTFEISSLWPGIITLVPGQKIMQMVLWDMVSPPERDYTETGRYCGQKGATVQR